MKLLFILPQNPFLLNDGLTLIINQWLNLLVYDHQVYIAISNPKEGDADSLKNHLPNVTLLEWQKETQPEKAGGFPFNWFDKKVLNYHLFRFQLHSLISYYHQQNKFDAIITFGIKNSAYQFHLRDCVKVCHVVDDPIKQNWPKAHSLWQKIKNYKPVVISLYSSWRFAKKMNLLLTVTDEDSKALAKYSFHPNIKTICNGVDTEFFTPGQEGEVPSVIFTGNMDFFSNIEAVQFFSTKVWPLVNKTNKPAEFWIVGRNPTAEVLALNSPETNIKVVGAVPDITEYLAKSWVVAVPMVVGTGIKNKTLEAWSMAKPVVTTSIATQGLIIDEGKNCFVRDSAEDIAKSVLDLLSSQELRNQMGKTARQTVLEHYTWSGQVNKLLNEIKKCQD